MHSTDPSATIQILDIEKRIRTPSSAIHSAQGHLDNTHIHCRTVGTLQQTAQPIMAVKYIDYLKCA